MEDVTDIVLNLKKVLVISHKADPELTIEIEKEGEVTAGDISAEGIEIINPEQIILTTVASFKFWGDGGYRRSWFLLGR